MSKREQFDLTFYKKLFDGQIYYECSSNHHHNDYSSLCFISRLSKFESVSLRNDLKQCIDFETNVDEGFFSDSVEDRSIIYQFPNVNIDDILIISMLDLKELLDEWHIFIDS